MLTAGAIVFSGDDILAKARQADGIPSEIR